ncbi:hypothetical protein Q6247_26485, partial [Klebsiella pneumoniae]
VTASNHLQPADAAVALYGQHFKAQPNVCQIFFFFLLSTSQICLCATSKYHLYFEMSLSGAMGDGQRKYPSLL